MRKESESTIVDVEDDLGKKSWRGLTRGGYVPRVCGGGGGCASGGVPLGAVPALLVWGDVSRGFTNHQQRRIRFGLGLWVRVSLTLTLTRGEPTVVDVENDLHKQRRVGIWPLHDIAIPNIVWCMAYTREVGGGPILRNGRAIALH